MQSLVGKVVSHLKLNIKRGNFTKISMYFNKMIDLFDITDTEDKLAYTIRVFEVCIRIKNSKYMLRQLDNILELYSSVNEKHSISYKF